IDREERRNALPRRPLVQPPLRLVKESATFPARSKRSAPRGVVQRLGLRSAPVSGAGERVSRSRTFLVQYEIPRVSRAKKIVSARRRNQHPRRMRSPERTTLDDFA